MSSIHNPREKKRLAYDRDHYAKSEYDKARNGWRIKKHKARRSYRHAVDSRAKAAKLDGESDSKILSIMRRTPRRWPVPSLRERVRKNSHGVTGPNKTGKNEARQNGTDD